jgi:hypothetical protein
MSSTATLTNALLAQFPLPTYRVTTPSRQAERREYPFNHTHQFPSHRRVAGCAGDFREFLRQFHYVDLLCHGGSLQ